MHWIEEISWRTFATIFIVGFGALAGAVIWELVKILFSNLVISLQITGGITVIWLSHLLYYLIQLRRNRVVK